MSTDLISQNQDQTGMELTEKLASDIADHIYMLGTNVLILSDSDIRLISYACSDRDIYVKSKSPTDVTEAEMHNFSTVLLWNVMDLFGIPRDASNLTYNLISNVPYENVAYDYITPDNILSFNIPTETGTTQEVSEKIAQEMEIYWPDFYSKYKDTTGYINGSTYSPTHLVNITTANHRQYVKQLFDNGATKIVISQIHEGARSRFFKKAQLIADSCRDFLDQENFYITTVGINADVAWQEYCANHFIDFPVNVMICSNIDKSCLPDESTKAVLDKPYDSQSIHDNVYTCLNAGMQRLHRMLLGIELSEYDLLKKGKVSMSDYTDWIEYSTYGSDSARQRFLSETPCWLDLKISDKGGTIHQNVHQSQLGLYDSYLSLVAETDYFTEAPEWFNEDLNLPGTIFRTEKTIKPMWFKHPFIVLGAKHYMKAMRDAGYKTFHPYIDESYDEEGDDILRLKMVVAEVNRLSKFSTQEWLDWKSSVADIVEHNYKWLTS